MHISGFLPSPAATTRAPDQQAGNSSPSRDAMDARPRSRRQPTEFIFDGEVIDETRANETGRKAYQQQIDPARRHAIASYTEQQTLQPRRGQLLDIFI